MGTFDRAADRTRITKALNLDIWQDVENSLLDSLMTSLEDHDLEYSVDYVTEVKNCLDEIDTYNTALKTAAAQNQNYTLLTIDDWITAKFGSSSGATQGTRNLRDGCITRIKNILDREGQLIQYEMTSRNIPTL